MSALIQDSNLFISQTHDRARNFIKADIWASISQDRLNNWIRQFEQYEASLLGAVLLDNLIYKSKAQVKAMLSCLMTGPELCRSFTTDFELVEKLAHRNEPAVRIVPAISLSQPPTKSGFYILRLLQRLFRIQATWLIWPQQVASLDRQASLLIIVDDFLGSGDQFSEFALLTKLDELHKTRSDVRVVYLVLAAHQAGIDAIQAKHPYIEVICADVLNDDYHIFHGGRLDVRYRANLAATLKQDYMTLAQKAQLPRSGNVGPFGYGNLGLCYAFEHSTPNNVLPAYWYETANWTTLLDR